MVGVRRCCCRWTIKSFDGSDGSFRFKLDHGPGQPSASRSILADGTDLYDIGTAVTGQTNGTLQLWEDIDTLLPSRAWYSDYDSTNFSDEATGKPNKGHHPNTTLVKNSNGVYAVDSANVDNPYPSSLNTKPLSKWSSSTGVQSAQVTGNQFHLFESNVTSGNIDVLDPTAFADYILRSYDSDLASPSSGDSSLAGDSIGPQFLQMASGEYICAVGAAGSAATAIHHLIHWADDLSLNGYTYFSGVDCTSGIATIATLGEDGDELFWSTYEHNSQVETLGRATLPFSNTIETPYNPTDWTQTPSRRVLAMTDASGGDIYTAELSGTNLYVVLRDGDDGSVTWETSMGTSSYTSAVLHRTGDDVAVGGQWNSSGEKHVAIVDSSGSITWAVAASSKSTPTINDLEIDDDGHVYIACDRTTG